MSEYKSLSDYDIGGAKAGQKRQRQAVRLYNYLITTAKANAAGYKDGTTESNTTITLYTNATIEDTQPVILIDRKPVVKEFDLALRKYITKLNGDELAETSTRVPSIEEASLETETTATYKHRKDPVKVETGDIVTYNLTVYNEGEKDGRVTKIIDQLPTGLKFKSLLTTGFTAEYDETANRLTITRDASNQTNLGAYTEGSLQSETIEIECEVTKKPDAESQVILTNVAWIAEEYDAEGKITITTEVGKDRDSEPGTAPNVDKDSMSNYKGITTETDLSQNIYYPGEQDDDDFEKLVLEPKTFDLKLIKRIVEVNGASVPERIESVDVRKLNTIGADGKKITTATYNLNKEPVLVKQGDIVKYTFRVYNEGDIDGYAQEISENIPEGLEFLWSEKVGEELQLDETLTDAEKMAITYNQGIWNIGELDTETEKVNTIKTNYLAKGEGLEKAGTGSNLIKAFDTTKGYVDTESDKNPDYKEVSVYLKVVAADSTGVVIRNEAAITDDMDKDGNAVTDRDSEPENWVGKEDPSKYQDDEDYDNIKLQTFDLSLRKFIIAVSPDEKIEDTEYLKNKDGAYTRAPQVDTSKLNTVGEDGKLITTAIYNHTKEPVEVKKNDYVVYMLRVYNESELRGYASEIKDHLPENLEFVNGEFNKKYGWEASEDGRTVTTNYLADYPIQGTTTNTEGKIVLSYKEVPIMCKIKETAKAQEKITNIADITEYKDENKKDITDRDSVPENVVLPDDTKLPTYKDDETGNYVPGQEDDDDFEKVIVKTFDLALRKFITGVDKNEVTTRIPEVKLDSETNKITYEHTKEPVEVVTGNVVTYTIRVFNEGQIDGYATEITDDLPAGLEFIPDNEINKEYRWVMYDEEGKETTDVSKAKKITTDYLSKVQGEARMNEDEEAAENPNLLKAFDPNAEISETNPDYKDVKVAFKVVESNTSDKILVNAAQISEDSDKNGNPVDDIDSVPDKWNEGEDDQDKEYVKLTYFDLALRKWVTQAIVVEDGKESITQTGHTPEQDPEPIVKVEINRKKLSKVTVKFRYSIRITNEGDIAGYAKEITDYVPEGLKFVAADNPQWKDEGNNVISTTALQNRLLQPGEHADVEVVLTWINGQDNMGVKTNTAEISKDYNDKGAPDRDSTPDNKKAGEDDIDDAPVMLSISTGQARIYYTLGFVVLITIAGGVALIKKYVL